MNEKGVNPPKHLEVDGVNMPRLFRWLQLLADVFPRVRTYTVTLDPGSVSANSESVETVTVAGLTTQDIVTVNKPTDTAGISIGQAWVSAANTLKIKFINITGGAVDPGSEDYFISAVRR